MKIEPQRETSVDTLQTGGYDHNTVVVVRWLDSIQPSHEWEWLDEVVQRSAIRVNSVGFLVYINDEVLALAGSIAGGDADHREQVIGITRIPRKCILTSWVIHHDG